MPIERPKPLGYCSVCLSIGPPDLSRTIVPKVYTRVPNPKVIRNTAGQPKIMCQVTRWLCHSSGPSSLWSPRCWTIPISFEDWRSFAKKDVGCMASANQSKRDISDCLFLDLFRSQLKLDKCPPSEDTTVRHRRAPPPSWRFCTSMSKCGHPTRSREQTDIMLEHAGKTCVIWFSGVFLRPLQKWIEKSNAKALAHLFDKLVVGHHEEARGGGLFHKYVTCLANQHQQYKCCSASNPWIRPGSMYSYRNAVETKKQVITRNIDINIVEKCW